MSQRKNPIYDGTANSWRALNEVAFGKARLAANTAAARALNAAGAKPSVEAIGREPTYTRLEQILLEAAG